jgi:hypothetical protein
MIQQSYPEMEGSPPASVEVANQTFIAIAKVHATF